MSDNPIKYGGRFRHSSDVDAFLNQPTTVSKYVSDHLASASVSSEPVRYEVDDTPYVPPTKWKILRLRARNKFGDLRRRVFPYYLVRINDDCEDE